MAVDPLETRRQRVLDALADGASRTWTVGNGQNQISFTVANPQIRVLNDTRVLSVDLTISRGGVVRYADRVNMPNPAVAVRSGASNVTDNPLAAIRTQLLDTARAATLNFTVIHDMRDGQGGFLGDTLSVRSSTADGTISSGTNATWTNVMNGVGLSVSASGSNEVVATALKSGANFSAKESFFDFDTSSLGAGATVSAAVFTLYASGVKSDADTLTFQARAFDWSSGGLTTADWRNSAGLASATLFATKTISAWTPTADTANDFSSDAGAPALVNKTGTTYLVTCLSNMPTTTTAPTGNNTATCRMADNTGTSSDPLLTVTYTSAVNASITGVTGSATADGIAGSVTAQVAVSVTGVTGAADAAGVAGSVTAVQTVSITGITAPATADGIAGEVNTGVNASITGVTGEATADGIAGSVSTVQIVSITGVTASADATGIAGSVTAGVQISITGETATATADGIAGSVTAQVQVTVTGVTGVATADGIVGAVTALQVVSVTGITATATATGIAGAVTVTISVTGITATATATGIAGIIAIAVPILLIARYAPVAGLDARYAVIDQIAARYAVQEALEARYALEQSYFARYANRPDNIGARFAPVAESEARFD